MVKPSVFAPLHTVCVILVLVCPMIVTGCGKKPSLLQPKAAPLAQDPAYYPYPPIQKVPPVPAAPSPPPAS